MKIRAPANTFQRQIADADLVLTFGIAERTANNSNQNGHPAPTIRALLDRKGVEVATVLVWSENGTSKVSWVDTMTSTTIAVHKEGIVAPKRYDKLSQHADHIRARRVGAPYRSL